MKLFVTGSGTEVGKTYVTAALVRRWRAAGQKVRAVKPLASGLPSLDDPAFALSDPAILLAAQDLPVSADALETCCPWRFTAPLSPDMAARAEARRIDFAAVVDWTRGVLADRDPDHILVEGVGGIMSPVADDATGLDLAKALGLPTLLVCGSYLGAISHGLTALAVLKAASLPVAALVVNESAETAAAPLGEVVETFRRFAGDTPILLLRRDGGLAFDPRPEDAPGRS